MVALGYTTAELCMAQTEDRNIVQLLQAMQCNQWPEIINESNGESLECRHHLLQWDQLVVQEGVLW